MSGGRWTTQNKVRAGAYINFISVPRPSLTVGGRGIAIIPLDLNWGAEDELIEVFSSDMLDGSSLAKIGVSSLDPTAIGLSLMLSECHTALVYRLNRGGEKAQTTLGNLSVTAKHSGEFGNNIHVAILTADEGLYEVKTFVNKRLRDSQRVADITELTPNDFVVFDMIDGEYELEEFAGEPLEGGENGGIEGDVISAFLEKAGRSRWQVMAINSHTPIEKTAMINFIINQNENEGRAVQGIGHDVGDVNQRYISDTNQYATIGEQAVSDMDLVAWITGMSAGAELGEDLTSNVLSGVTAINPDYTNTEIINLLTAGKFILTRNQNGTIKIEDDINTLVRPRPSESIAWRSNRVVRGMAEIETSIRDNWESRYMGQVDNNLAGRDLYRGDIIQYFRTLEALGVIQNFEPDTDVSVEQGVNADDVKVTVGVQFVKTMKKLYLNVMVRS